jgi:hypothetical protein
MVSVALHANVARHMRSEWINRPQNRLKNLIRESTMATVIIKISILLHCPGP